MLEGILLCSILLELYPSNSLDSAAIINNFYLYVSKITFHPGKTVKIPMVTSCRCGMSDIV